MPFKTCFIVSVFFLWAFGYVSKKFEKKILKNPCKENVRKGWILITAGITLSAMELLAYLLIHDKQYPLNSIILWFGCFGIFSILYLRIVHGLFKCLSGRN